MCMKQDNIIATQGLTNLFAGQPDSKRPKTDLVI